MSKQYEIDEQIVTAMAIANENYAEYTKSVHLLSKVNKLLDALHSGDKCEWSFRVEVAATNYGETCSIAPSECKQVALEMWASILEKRVANCEECLKQQFGFEAKTNGGE